MDSLKNVILTKAAINEDNNFQSDTFLTQYMDCNLINEMALEIYDRFKGEGVTKVLTIEASGIALACACALMFKTPLVFAKKDYSTKLPDNTLASKIYSASLKRSYYAYVNEDFINEDDKVLIVDDEVANGWASEGLCDIVNQAGADLCGIACAMEKCFSMGAKRLRSKGIRVESLVKIKSVSSDTKTIEFE